MFLSSLGSIPGRITPTVALALCCGCAATTTNVYLAAGNKTICHPQAAPLGQVAILPEAAWRADQKDVGERLEMARRAIEAAFENFACGNLREPGGIRGFSRWAERPEAEVLAELRTQGVETVIFLRLEELTPRFLITWSVPFLWSGTSEADLRVRVVTTETNAVVADFRMKRSTGGPFHVRPARWAEAELEAALRVVIDGSPRLR